MIYLDSCVVIYWVENHSVFAPRIEQRILQTPTAEFAISPLVMAEVLVMPFRQNNTLLIERFEVFFANSILLTLPETVFVQTARLRATYPSLKMPDALTSCISRLATSKQYPTHETHRWV